ncbi:hypothetical protein POM88_044087 [Heracleum sosnowskyi]|uniref:Uncharacterized protein n=1 Tax=Heracleum sosnowskyi TaxID=360622 RepID=A0AAD8M530_9APIA|nr:hypothetical protein POM88_044087 [Heracleum sosnowskyi]
MVQLRQSRVIRSRESIVVPTWTGKSGAAGAPSSVRQKFGIGKALTSSELLARIRGNQERAVGDGIEQQFGQASSSTGRANIANNSTVKSSNLSGEIATLEKNSSGSSWVLKPEYQEEQ